MKVYIAAPYPCKEDARLVRTFLETHGINCTSQWIDEEDGEDSAERAQKDLDDVNEAHVFIALNFLEWEQRGTGGRHVEFGYAIGTMPIILIGKRSNVFHHLPEIKVVEKIQDALVYLKAIEHEIELHGITRELIKNEMDR